jgi:twitching motility protein PilU
MEVMLQSPLISDLIFKGEVLRIKEVMAKSTRIGMQTFDQDLFNLYESGKISYDEAIRNSDSKNELRLRVKLESKRDKSVANDDSGGLTVMEEDKKATLY